MKHFLSILLFLSVFSVIAQENNKKKVLVIPYNRFDLVSEFSMETIAEKNQITVSEVFFNYQKTLLNAFDSLDNENFEFIPLKHNTITPYKKHIKYESGKFKGKRYNKVNLNDLKEEDFTKLLELHGADFIVFITWYEIKKESFVRAGEHRKRVDYAGHYFDYDVFNLFKQRVIGEGRVKIKASEPNDEQASYSLLRTKELEELYQNFATHIIEQVSKPIE